MGSIIRMCELTGIYIRSFHKTLYEYSPCIISVTVQLSISAECNRVNNHLVTIPAPTVMTASNTLPRVPSPDSDQDMFSQ